MEKLIGIQFARAIAVLLVIVFHISNLSMEYADSVIYDPALSVLQSGVDIFFVISGVIMVKTACPPGGRTLATTTFLERRLTRIYPPYLVVTLLLTAFLLVNPHSINKSQSSIDLFTSYTLIPSRQLPLLPVAWTLSYEVYFYLVFSILLFFPRRIVTSLILWAALICLGNIVFWLSPAAAAATAPFGQFFASPFVFEFIAGCFLGLASIDQKSRSSIWLLFVGIVFACEMLAFHLWDAPIDIPVDLRVLCFGPMAVLLVAWFCALQIGDNKFWPVRYFLRIGEISYALYLTHILAIHAAYRYVWPRFNFSSWLLFFSVLTFAICIIGGEVFFRAIESKSIVVVRSGMNWLIARVRNEDYGRRVV